MNMEYKKNNEYASDAISFVSNHIKNGLKSRMLKLITHKQVKEHNMNVMKDYRNDNYLFNSMFICQCYGCRNRFSTSNYDCDKEEILKLIDNDKLFCPTCKENGKSIAFEKLLKTFPIAFITGESKTDISKLPQEAFSKITSWNEKNVLSGDCVRSLYVYGKTGCGKSRIATLLALKNLEYGITMNCIRGGHFAKKLRKYADSENKGAEASWLDNLSRCNVLIFDDFGRDNLTPPMFEKLWALLDSRLGNKTTIFLSNFEPDNNPSTDMSLTRRIADFCDVLKID